MEKIAILRNVMGEHLGKHCLIKDSQHGFWHRRLCFIKLLESFKDITAMID